MIVGRFLDPIRIEKIGRRRYRLLTSFEYRIGSVYGDEFVRVMEGFETDFASIPRLLWWLWPPMGGDYDGAALIHDCLYKTGYVSRNNGTTRTIQRNEADLIMLEGMAVSDTPLPTRRAIYRGVRLGGFIAWRKHRKADHADAQAA